MRLAEYGYVRVATCIPRVKVADIEYNVDELLRLAFEASEQHASIVCFPELSITGYTCGDLFLQRWFYEKAQQGLYRFMARMPRDLVAIVGCPCIVDDVMYNCAYVIENAHIKGIVPKTYLPNYGEFYEKRWFSTLKDIGASNQNVWLREDEFTNVSFGSGLTFTDSTSNVTFGVEICEDLWAPIPPSSDIVLKGASIIFNLSATNELIGKHSYLVDLIKQQSARCNCAYVYSSSGFGESSQDLAFAGNAIVAENGAIIAKSNRFALDPQIVVTDIDTEKILNERVKNKTFACSLEEKKATFATKPKDDPSDVEIGIYRGYDEVDLKRNVIPHPFVPSSKDSKMARCQEILEIQSHGLAQRLNHIGPNCKAVIGISGGLDSTLALIVTLKAFEKTSRPFKDIIGVTMPCFGTSERTLKNSQLLMKAFGITDMTIDITKAVTQHLTDIDHSIDNEDVTFENAQARERTKVLMDIANMYGGIVIGTGDLSELALGWCTYNADHMSMYNVNVSIPKTLVKHIVECYAEDLETTYHGVECKVDLLEQADILRDICHTPISPELTRPDKDGKIAQKTEDKIGEYELIDFIMYNFLRNGYGPDKIFMLMKHCNENEVLHFDKKYTSEHLKKVLKTFFWRFFSQQFKRSCLPDGPKVGSVSLSPRGDWRMPSDACAKVWIDEIDDIEDNEKEGEDERR